MSELLAYLFGAGCIVEGLYIWVLKSSNDSLKGGIVRLNRENADLSRTLKVTRSRIGHRLGDKP